MSKTPREEGGQAKEEGAVRVGRGLDFSEEDIAEASAWADSADGRKILRLLRYRGKLSVGELLTGVGGPRVGFTRSPEDLQARAAEYRDAIVERVAASDDEQPDRPPSRRRFLPSSIGLTAMVDRIQSRDAFMVKTMQIEGASAAVDKGLRAMLPVTLPAGVSGGTLRAVYPAGLRPGADELAFLVSMADHAGTAHLFDMAVAVGDGPSTRHQLHRRPRQVHDLDLVGPDPAAFVWIGLARQIAGPHPDQDAVRLGGIGRTIVHGLYARPAARGLQARLGDKS